MTTVENNISTQISEKLEEYETSLKEIVSSISSLNLISTKDYLSVLGSIPHFDALFGFGGAFGIYYTNRELHELTEEPSFTTALTNIFRRRVYFYLAELYQTFLPANGDKNVKLLMEEFKKYRRVEAYGLDDVIKYLNEVEDSQRYSLAPLYETFVDSELFTTLVYLDPSTAAEGSTPWPASIEWANKDKFIHALTTRLSSILDDSITDDHRIKNSISDESFVLWGIRLLFEIKGDQFSIGSKFVGTKSFFELTKSLAQRPHDQRRHPQQKDLVLEITPEIRTLERTNLYSALNLIKILSQMKRAKKNMNTDDQDSIEAVVKSIKTILTEYILDQELPQNLYFICLKYTCLTEYNMIFSGSSNDTQQQGGSIGQFGIDEIGQFRIKE
ncbi:MAG: hypothetical protein IIA59_06755 [Candidatus Marinimicrobia bacterium]|nr:hypothetical protein [Candidatus Neomarinimicrobiota bacterium]